MKSLLILGAGQYGKVVKELAEETGEYDIIDFLDDNSEVAIGKMDDLCRCIKKYHYAIPAIGNSELRLQLIETAEKIGYEIPVLISKKAFVSKTAKLDKGVVIEPLAGVHAYAEIKAGSYISMGAVVNHDAVVEEGCHIDNNAVVMSSAKVKAQTKVFPCSVIQKIKAKS